jgi:type IV secretory pathway VirJ component
MMRTKLLLVWVAAVALMLVRVSPAWGSPAHPRHGGAVVNSADSVTDLPLVVVRASGAPSGTLAVMLTGDGGWAALDRTLADSIAAHGTPVVALDSRTYLSRQHDPDSAANDLARILRHYLPYSAASRVLLVGYSRGADVLPFMATRLPPDLLAKVRVVALLGPASNANFRFHLIDLISNRHRKDDLPTVPEIEKLRGRRILCFYGVKEKQSACPSLPPGLATSFEMPDGHHFGKRYGEIGARIVEALSEKK